MSAGAGKSESSECVITFDEAPEAGVVNFGVGQTSADLLPRERCRSRVERMHRVLHEHLAEFAICPEGGYFFWLELAKGVDATRLRERSVI